jgi:hypothetical protein
LVKHWIFNAYTGADYCHIYTTRKQYKRWVRCINLWYFYCRVFWNFCFCVDIYCLASRLACSINLWISINWPLHCWKMWKTFDKETYRPALSNKGKKTFFLRWCLCVRKFRFWVVGLKTKFLTNNCMLEDVKHCRRIESNLIFSCDCTCYSKREWNILCKICLSVIGGQMCRSDTARLL